jgi:hypothetical protein
MVFIHPPDVWRNGCRSAAKNAQIRFDVEVSSSILRIAFLLADD